MEDDDDDDDDDASEGVAGIAVRWRDGLFLDDAPLGLLLLFFFLFFPWYRLLR